LLICQFLFSIKALYIKSLKQKYVKR
jgi:hypothetical protein